MIKEITRKFQLRKLSSRYLSFISNYQCRNIMCFRVKEQRCRCLKLFSVQKTREIKQSHRYSFLLLRFPCKRLFHHLLTPNHKTLKPSPQRSTTIISLCGGKTKWCRQVETHGKMISLKRDNFWRFTVLIWSSVSKCTYIRALQRPVALSHRSKCVRLLSEIFLKFKQSLFCLIHVAKQQKKKPKKKKITNKSLNFSEYWLCQKITIRFYFVQKWRQTDYTLGK